ncbi:MAG: hypothetical protein QXK76_02780 [Candidatus Woesearchaeota archaeon]
MIFNIFKINNKSLMLLLFLCIFLAIDNVYASLYVSGVYGSNGLKDFRKVNDTVAFNITSTSNITLINNVQPTCIKESMHYYCVLTDIQNQAVASYNIINQEGNSITASINVDNSIGSIDYSLVNNNGSIVLNYNIIDTGFNGNNVCSGIRSIDIWWKNSNVGTITSGNANNPNNNGCVVSGTINLSITESGSGEFYIEVMDNVDNKKTYFENITIDITEPEISGLEILNNNIPLNTIALNTDFDVDILFDIVEENLTSIIVDISDITTNPALKPVYKNIAVPLSSCKINNTDEGKKHSCIIPLKNLRTAKSSVYIEITANDGSGNYKKERLEKTFNIDNIIPAVTAETDYCDEKDCYVKNGMNKIIFKLTKNNFGKKLLFYDINGVTNRVLNCTENECFGNAVIDCNGPVQLRILNTLPYISQDDSGNRLPFYSRTFKCDNSLPSIINTSWMSNNNLGQNLLVTGSSLSLLVTVYEPDSKVKATAYFDLIKNETIEAKCNKLNLSNIFNCTWSVSPINDGYYDANVIITVSDIVNNTIQKTEKVRILGFKSDNLTPSNLKAVYSKTVPSSLNRAVLKLAEFNNIPINAYAYYSVSVKQGIDVQLLSQELSIDDCVLREKDGDTIEASILFSEIKLADKYKGIGNNHRIDFTFGQSAGSYNKFSDDTKVVCNISAYVREGKYVYKKPQILPLEITFNLRNSQLDAPGEEYVNKIKSLEKSTENDYSKLIKTLDDAMVKLQNICTIKEKLDYAGMSGVVIQLAGFALPGFGNGLKETGGNIIELVRQANSIVYEPELDKDFYSKEETKELPLMGFIGQACTFMSCNLEINKPLQLDRDFANNIQELSSKVPFVGEDLGTNLLASDLKNSMVMSALKLCVPGIVYNLNKYRQIDCEYLECLKVYSASGLDVSQCEVMKSSKVCSIIVGEAFELPYIRVFKNIFSNAADVLRLSFGKGFVAILKKISESDICKDVSSDGAIFSCNIPYALEQYLSTQQKSRTSELFYYKQTRDFCKSAGCVGLDCYPSNSINIGGLQIPLPQYVPTAEQQLQLNLMRQFGPFYDSRYLLINAHGSSKDSERKENLEKWNNMVKDYNKKYGTNYPTIEDIGGIEELSRRTEQSQAKLSRYYSGFSEVGGTPEEKKKYSELIQRGDPRMEYLKMKEELYRIEQQIKNNPININEAVVWRDEDVIRNNKPEDKKESIKLLNVLPYGNDQKSLGILNGKGGTDKDKYYYYENNAIWFYQKDKGDLKVISYDENGKPQKLDVLELGNGEKQKWKDFIENPQINKLKKSFDEYTEKQNELDKKRPDYYKARDEYKKYMMKQKAVTFVSILMDQLGFRKFLTAEYWSDKMGLAEYITKVSDAVDPEIWKNNLCNPDNGPLLTGNEQPEGTVYSCYNAPGQGCKLVLTYGAEDFDYGNGTTLYTITYLVGPVLRDVSFNIKLKGPEGTALWYERDKILKAYNYDSAATAILSKKKYTHVCVLFRGDFPDKGDSPKEFCRQIKKDVLRTGRPVLDDNVPGYPAGNIGSGKPFKGG